MMTVMVPDLLDPTEEMHGLCVRIARDLHEVEAWIKAHPSGKSVVIRGDTAILSFYDPKLGPQQGVRSSDIFVYEDGHWHALYSQHSAAGGG